MTERFYTTLIGVGIVVLVVLLLSNNTDVAVKGGEASSYFVAASDAPLAVQAKADYIADGTCDEEQVKQAISSLTVGVGGTVQLSGGRFYFCSPVDITAIQAPQGWGWIIGKVTIRGDGRESTRIQPTAPMTSLFRAVSPSGVTVRNVAIRDLHLYDDAPFVTVSLVDIAGKMGGYSGFNTVDNVFLYLRAPTTGSLSAVFYRAQMASSITNTMMTIVGGSGGDVYGFRQYGGSFTTLNMDNVVIEGDYSGHTYGVLSAGWKHSLRHVIVEGHKVGVEFTSRDGGASRSNDISGAYLEGNEIDIRLRGTSGGIQHTGSVIRDSLFGGGLVAVDLEYAQDITIQGNTFEGNYALGAIREGAGVARIQARNNRGYVSEQAGSAIILSGTTSVSVVHGLAATPTRVQITLRSQPSNPVSLWWADSVTPTQFTIHVDRDPGSDLLLDWYVVRE